MTAASNIDAISAVQSVTADEQSATISTAISGRPSRTRLSMARIIVNRIVGWSNMWSRALGQYCGNAKILALNR
jgi:hypothetical protein